MSTTDFVLHEHFSTGHAGHHMDLRIKYLNKEKLASWALPKAKIPKERDRLLAVRTEDHAMFWLKFRGTIPEGEYGAGEVEIAQSGRMEIVHWKSNGIVFEVTGRPMNGRYALILMKTKKKTKEETWLFIKMKEREEYDNTY
jgi:bifunctional non-homologous end joining protein LigD